MKEIWKDIPNYEGLYQISSFGNVKSFPRKGTQTRKERILKFKKDKKGYFFVHLSKNNIQKSIKIHRKVAILFIPNPLNKPQINHIDGNKQNNKLENLEWCTNGENQLHAYKIGLQKMGQIRKDRISIARINGIKKRKEEQLC